MNKLEEFIIKTKPSEKETKLLKDFYLFMETQSKVFNTPKRIAFIHEDVGHLTGGRYYAWFIASALATLGHSVTIYTNRQPVFAAEFKDYKKPRVAIAAMNARRLSMLDIKADVYMGSPIQGALCASRLGKKYSKPAFSLIFDPFPAMDKYIGRGAFVGWDELLKNLRENNTNIISLCNAMSEYIYPWLKKSRSQVFPVPPCINSKVFDQRPRVYPKEDYVVFISRMVRHKRFEDAVSAVAKTNLRLKVISSVSGLNAQAIVNAHKMDKRVDWHWKCSDDEKFDIIAKSRGVIVPSVFEGYGIFVAEAIACGVPFIGYDYETFREIRDYAKADNVYLAKYKDPFDLSRKLKQAIGEKKYNPISKAFHFEAMMEALKNI